MLCDACKKREAVVHIVKIEDGQRTDVHLCAPVPRDSQTSQICEMSILSIMIFPQDGLSRLSGRSRHEPRCASCGMTYGEFNHVGKFGCPDCYEAFKEEIPPLLRRIHGHSKHVARCRTAGPVSSGRPRRSSACASTCRSSFRKNAMKKQPRSATKSGRSSANFRPMERGNKPWFSICSWRRSAPGRTGPVSSVISSLTAGFD